MLNVRKWLANVSILAAVTVTLCTVGCSDIEVGSAWAPQSASRPALGRTFAWVSEANRELDDLEGVQPALRDLARETIQQEYIKKGYEKGAAGQADFWLRAKVAKATRGDAYSAGTFEQYTEGTLVLYIIDPADGQWLWRGWGSARLQEGNSPEEKRERLSKAIQGMLRGIPDGPLAKKK